MINTHSTAASSAAANTSESLSLYYYCLFVVIFSD